MAYKSAAVVFEYSVHADERKSVEKQLECQAASYTVEQLKNRGAIDPVDVVVYAPGAGSSLTECAQYIVDLAIKSNAKHAGMMFNGVLPIVDASTGESSEVLVEKMQADYSAKLKEQHEVYKKTPEYAERKLIEVAEKVKNIGKEQKFFEQAMAALNDKSVAADSSPVLFKALGEWIQVSDNVGIASVGVHREQVIEALEARGFKSGEGVGDKAVKDKTDPVAYGRYCVGQFIHMATNKTGAFAGAVHPLIGEWMVGHADSSELLAIHQQRQLDSPANTKLTDAKGKGLRA